MWHIGWGRGVDYLLAELHEIVTELQPFAFFGGQFLML